MLAVNSRSLLRVTFKTCVIKFYYFNEHYFIQTSKAAEVIQRQLNVALQQNGVVLPQQLLQYNQSQVDGASDCPITGPDSPPPSELPSTSGQSKGISVTSLAPRKAMDRILDQGLKRARREGSALTQAQTDGGVGLGDSSDEMSDDDDDDDEEEEEDNAAKDDVDDEEDDADDVNEDPLNSDDDVTDDDVTDVFETDNVVVCQYDKVSF